MFASCCSCCLLCLACRPGVLAAVLAALACLEASVPPPLPGRTYIKEMDPKRVYYLSMEFLMGRSLLNALYNLDIKDQVGPGSVVVVGRARKGANLRRQWSCCQDAGGICFGCCSEGAKPSRPAIYWATPPNPLQYSLVNP